MWKHFSSKFASLNFFFDQNLYFVLGFKTLNLDNVLSQYGNGHRAEIEFPGMSEPEVITHFLLMQNLINSKFILIFNILAIFPRILFFNMAHFLIFLQILIFNMAH